MGLIRAAVGALGGTLADQWKEFFYCDALAGNVLVTKGQKRISGRSSNTKGNDNIISNGSGIAVADGQCMIIVEQGKVVEVCAEPGEFTYDASTEPSIFAGSLGRSILDTFKTIGKRFTYGGDTGKDQRVYYFNTKELIDNKFGTPNPIPFRVVDKNIGLDIDVAVRCNGVYSYKIADPLLFYTNVCGNVERDYTRADIEGQLKTEFLSALQPAFAKISEMGIRYSALPGHAEQQTAIMRGRTVAAATLVGAQAEAMKSAAKNENGAMMGFMGATMAQQAGGVNAQNLFALGAQQQTEKKPEAEPSDAWPCSCGATASGNFCTECGAKRPAANGNKTWQCSCGAQAQGNFCTECGAKRPEEGWSCACGAVNQGKFCSECGAKKPAGAPLYRCDKCGWEPEDPHHPPKFCPECGDNFDEKDKQ